MIMTKIHKTKVASVILSCLTEAINILSENLDSNTPVETFVGMSKDDIYRLLEKFKGDDKTCLFLLDDGSVHINWPKE